MHSIGCDVGWAWARHRFCTDGWIGGSDAGHMVKLTTHYDFFVNDIYHAMDHWPPMISLRNNLLCFIFNKSNPKDIGVICQI